MTTIDLGQIIGILANIGVIAGILFLAVELRQNNQLLRVEALNTVFERQLEFGRDIYLNENAAELDAKNRRKEPLTDVELRRIRERTNSGLFFLEKIYFMYQEGLVTEEDLRSRFSRYKPIYSPQRTDFTLSPYDGWVDWSELASPGFVTFFERCILSDCDAIPR